MCYKEEHFFFLSFKLKFYNTFFHNSFDGQMKNFLPNCSAWNNNAKKTEIHIIIEKSIQD